MKSRQPLLILFIIILLIIALGVSSNNIDSIIERGTKIDSIGHILGFFLLTGILHSVIKLPLINLSICLIIYAGLTELGQLYLGFRNAELCDFIADLVGIALYVGCKWLFIIFGKQKIR